MRFSRYLPLAVDLLVEPLGTLFHVGDHEARIIFFSIAVRMVSDFPLIEVRPFVFQVFLVPCSGTAHRRVGLSTFLDSRERYTGRPRPSRSKHRIGSQGSRHIPFFGLAGPETQKPPGAAEPLHIQPHPEDNSGESSSSSAEVTGAKYRSRPRSEKTVFPERNHPPRPKYCSTSSLKGEETDRPARLTVAIVVSD